MVVSNRITIVIPAYNEANRIMQTLSDIEDYISRRSKFANLINQVIVVDDGSRDATIERSLRFLHKLPISVIPLATNSGKWAAIRTGIAASKNDWILLLDADGSASVFNLDNKDIVLWSFRSYFGSRFLPESNVSGKSFIRLIVSRGYKYYSSLLIYMSGMRAPDDLQAPFKLFNRVNLSSPLTVDRFAGDIEFFSKLKGVVEDVPIVFVHVRGSKVPVSAVFRMFVDSFIIFKK